MKTLIGTGLVPGFAGGRDAKSVVDELDATLRTLLTIPLLERLRQIQQRIQTSGTGDQQIAEMLPEGGYEMQGIEALGEYVVEFEKGGRIVPGKETVGQAETVFVVQHPEVAYDVGIFDVGAAEGNSLVEDGEGVAHCAVGLLGYHVQGLVIHLHAFFVGDGTQVAHHIGDAYTVEVVGLAAGKYGGEHLVLLGGAEDEDGV